MWELRLKLILPKKKGALKSGDSNTFNYGDVSLHGFVIMLQCLWFYTHMYCFLFKLIFFKTI
jgi:hypothetical protein